MLSDMLRTWDDPNARHALLVHLPIVLAGLGFLPLIALAATGFRNVTLKWVAIVWFLGASGGAALATWAGEEAEDALKQRVPALSRQESDAIHEHEELAEGGWIWPLIPAGLALVSLVRPRRIQIVAGTLALVGSVGVSGWIAATAHQGGVLVYEYGLGVPARSSAPATVEDPG